MNLKIKSILASALGTILLLSNGAGVMAAVKGSDLKMNDSDKKNEDTAKIGLTLPNEFTTDVAEIKVKVEIKTGEEWKLVTEQTYTEFDEKGKNHLTGGTDDSKVTFSDTGTKEGDRSRVDVDLKNAELTNLPKGKGEQTFRITVTITEKSSRTVTTKTRELTATNNGEGSWHD